MLAPLPSSPGRQPPKAPSVPSCRAGEEKSAGCGPRDPQAVPEWVPEASESHLPGDWATAGQVFYWRSTDTRAPRRATAWRRRRRGGSEPPDAGRPLPHPGKLPFEPFLRGVRSEGPREPGGGTGREGGSHSKLGCSGTRRNPGAPRNRRGARRQRGRSGSKLAAPLTDGASDGLTAWLSFAGPRAHARLCPDSGASGVVPAVSQGRVSRRRACRGLSSR